MTVGARPHGNSLAIYVADTGIGILPHDLPRLGDPFFQARATYDRPYEGTGLGLSIVRGLVGLHGGTIGSRKRARRGHLRHRAPAARLPPAPRRTSHSAKIETLPRRGRRQVLSMIHARPG